MKESEVLQSTILFEELAEIEGAVDRLPEHRANSLPFKLNQLIRKVKHCLTSSGDLVSAAFLIGWLKSKIGDSEELDNDFVNTTKDLENAYEVD